jgi:hypothetical protein
LTSEAQEGISPMPPLAPVDIPDDEISPIYDDEIEPDAEEEEGS